MPPNANVTTLLAELEGLKGKIVSVLEKKNATRSALRSKLSAALNLINKTSKNKRNNESPLKNIQTNLFANKIQNKPHVSKNLQKQYNKLKNWSRNLTLKSFKPNSNKNKLNRFYNNVENKPLSITRKNSIKGKMHTNPLFRRTIPKNPILNLTSNSNSEVSLPGSINGGSRKSSRN
jgi:uncharacterized phage infection (PIP) family protein YhgE